MITSTKEMEQNKMSKRILNRQGDMINFEAAYNAGNFSKAVYLEVLERSMENIKATIQEKPELFYMVEAEHNRLHRMIRQA
jgi:hypothetical protein